MTWIWALGLAFVVFLLAAFALKVPRAGWGAVGAALMLGLAGYALQGSPSKPGAPKAPAQSAAGEKAAMVEARQALSGRAGLPGNQWIVIADALARHGQFADAAKVLQGAVDKDPRNGDAWLALANSLVAHADGFLTPAAQYAFDHAIAATPGDPGPRYFLGLALARSNRLAEGRRVWAELLASAPAGAPWRAGLEQRLAELDAFIARVGQAQ